MFDDKKIVDDIFAGTDDAAPSQPVPAPSALLTPPPIGREMARDEEMKRDGAAAAADSHPPSTIPPSPHRFGFIKLLFVVIVVLALVAGAGYAAYTIMVTQPASDSVVKSVSDDGVVNDDDAGKSEGTQEEDVIEEPTPTILDSDGDGLTNAEELDAGTLSNNPDTDSDGLGDREEVKVYGTDPRDSDTDGDTFLDGQEVAGGYNPNGEGKLFNVPGN